MEVISIQPKQSIFRLAKPPVYVLCAIFTSIGGFAFGFDTGSIGPITLMPAFHSTFGTLSPTLHGLLVSCILIPGAIFSLFAGPIADRVSRTYAISLGGFMFAIGALICCLSSSLPQLYVGRLISGAGEGIFLSCINVYSIEIAPKRIRGTVACILQLLISMGLMSGYFVCYGSLKLSGDMSWRVPFICQVFVCSFLGAGAPFIPHSPRWLLMKGRRRDAEAALISLGIGSEEREELLAVACEAVEEAASAKTGPAWKNALAHYKEAFAPEVRGRTILALYMQATQQLSGIDGVLYYAPMLFTQAGLSSANASFLASGVTGIVSVVITALGQIFTDKWGRRPTLISGGIIMGIAMTGIGAVYAHPTASKEKGGQWTVIALIFVYFSSFVMSWAILIRIHVSEAQPVRTRASVSALSQSSNWIVNWVIAFTTPMFLKRTPSGPYFLWAATIWVAVVVFIVYLPETRGREMEDFDGKADSTLGRWIQGFFCKGTQDLSERSSVMDPELERGIAKATEDSEKKTEQ
ncbi:general substrate transporter [Pyronema domesticum]|nr:general substrate transporter [Pyronema domesticum]